MLQIKQHPLKNPAKVSVPGSKSYTHRSLIAAALSRETCELTNVLQSQDTAITRQALSQMGVPIRDNGDITVIEGQGGRLAPCETDIYLGNSGTSMRLLAGVAALGNTTYRLTGNQRMRERPMGDLLEGLQQLGVSARSFNGDGCPPILINGQRRKSSPVDLKCGVSSQYLSALLLIAPLLPQGLAITVTEGPVSRPYIDMTIDIMNDFGVSVSREDYQYFQVPPNQAYRGLAYEIEPDASQAGYFWAAAAITCTTVKVSGIDRNSRQGDARFVDVLEAMGCQISADPDGLAVTGGPLTAVEVDMGDMPDVVPTLAVAAAFAQGTTVIRNVAHLKEKESDRLSAVAEGLWKMGIKVVLYEDGLAITGGTPVGATIDTHDDHRLAMSFALAGLKVPGIVIREEKCVEKSFPDFWAVFNRLYKA